MAQHNSQSSFRGGEKLEVERSIIVKCEYGVRNNQGGETGV